VAGTNAVARLTGSGIPSLSLLSTDTGGRDWRVESGRSAVGNFDISDCSAGCAPRITIDSSGKVGIGTGSPDGTLHVKGNQAQLYVESTATGKPLGFLQAFGGASPDVRFGTSTNTPLAIYTNSQERMRIAANGGFILGGTETKQSSGGGPEKLSFQENVDPDTDPDRVCIANFVSDEEYARFLLDMKGNHEWAGPNDVDQNALLGWLSRGRLQCQGVGEGGFSLHAWKHSKLTNTITSGTTSFDVDDGSQFAIGDTARCDDELMTVTGKSGNTLTVTRGVPPSTAATHSGTTFITALGEDEAHARIAQSFDGDYGAEIAFSDGATASDNAYLSRPVANQILLRGNFAIHRADITLGNGDNNNKALGGATFAKVTGPTAAFAVTGFAGGSDGRTLLLYNSTSQTMTIKNNNTGSAAANRILTLTESDVALRANKQSFATFIYDSNQSLWILVATN
jgi:hypothetical protein